ncbi:hypothetical protein EIN_015400 [Entamoeba invadens IP1]|uniref:hypothetical protein n=1 Tax=Entamoeba invadens IP1 TaxID=370355 RepID=UPI0002C3CFB7|nr:hypothetical protein EIN_015400 [Entamoeba invadens IP1]ELP90381.1 hypothetical protein EIN_015400 [Entamoeba invadens IP1]|eukprot:XP_004257152.1 hypothetical protein EIN_015400 [Entamoeba invadens IP1]
MTVSRLYPITSTLEEGFNILKNECDTSNNSIRSPRTKFTKQFHFVEKGFGFPRYVFTDNDSIVKYLTNNVAVISSRIVIYNNWRQPIALLIRKGHTYKLISQNSLLLQVNVRRLIAMEVKVFNLGYNSGVCYTSKPATIIGLFLCNCSALSWNFIDLLDNRKYLDFTIPTLPSSKNVQLISPCQSNSVVFEMSKQKSYYHVNTDSSFTPLQAFALSIIRAFEIFSR